MNFSHLLPHLKAIRTHIERCEAGIAQEFGVEIRLKISLAEDKHFIDAIAKIVSDALYVPMNEMLNTSRREEIKDARHVAMHLCLRHIPDVTLEKIGDYFGKNYSTVIHARDRIKNLLDQDDADIKRKVTQCEKIIQLRSNPTTNESFIH